MPAAELVSSSSMHYMLVALLVGLLLLPGCKEGPAGAPTESSAAPSAPGPSASGQDDLLPASEVTSPRPSYSLADLSDQQLSRLVTRVGWTPTVVGKSRPGEDASTIRVAAFRKVGEQRLEAVVFVRCRKQDDRATSFEPGVAYFRDGTCHMDVVVRLGIRNKSTESKRLLEALLAASAT